MQLQIAYTGRNRCSSNGPESIGGYFTSESVPRVKVYDNAPIPALHTSIVCELKRIELVANCCELLEPLA